MNQMEKDKEEYGTNHRAKVLKMSVLMQWQNSQMRHDALQRGFMQMKYIVWVKKMEEQANKMAELESKLSANSDGAQVNRKKTMRVLYTEKYCIN